jgi:hypothetical protein
MTEDLLHGEGFTEVPYVEKKTNIEGPACPGLQRRRYRPEFLRADYIVVTSFFPHSLGLVKLIVSSYPAVLVPPFYRRAGDACCSLSSTLVERYRSPPAGH